MDVYEPDRSWRGKLRRRTVRLQQRRRVTQALERPMVSFAFDDAPVSSATAGRATLEARGLKGTWYISAGLLGTEAAVGRVVDEGDVRALAAAGHEIGCHTFSHLDCGAAAAAQIDADLQRNAESLADWGLPSPTTFAYPYGDVSLAAKRAVTGRFALSRALHPGLVAPGADLNQAPAVSMEGPDGEAIARWWLDRAERRKAWLILFAHGVDAAPSRFGMSAASLERLTDHALARGFEVVTVAQGAARVGGAVH